MANDDDDDSGSYTPPHSFKSSAVSTSNNTTTKRQNDYLGSSKLSSLHDSSSKIARYDPEEVKVNISSVKAAKSAALSKSNLFSLACSNSAEVTKLMDSISNTDPIEMTNTVISAISNTENDDLKEQLLNQLSEKVDANRRELERQQQETTTMMKNLGTSATDLIPGFGGSLPVGDGGGGSAAFNLQNIQIPDNLKDILQSVEKIQSQRERIRSVEANLSGNDGGDTTSSMVIDGKCFLLIIWLNHFQLYLSF